MTSEPLVVVGIGHDGPGGLAPEALLQQDLHVDTTTVQISHAKPLGTLHRLESESPMFILRARKA